MFVYAQPRETSLPEPQIGSATHSSLDGQRTSAGTPRELRDDALELRLALVGEGAGRRGHDGERRDGQRRKRQEDRWCRHSAGHVHPTVSGAAEQRLART